jgi:hypothetical protein
MCCICVVYVCTLFRRVLNVLDVFYLIQGGIFLITAFEFFPRGLSVSPDIMNHSAVTAINFIRALGNQNN